MTIAADLARHGFAIDARKLERALDRYPKLFAENAKIATRQTFATFRREFIRGSAVRMRRGRGGLARRWFWNVTGTTTTNTEGEFFTQSNIARLREYGGTVRAKKSRFLAIPIGFARTPKGRTKKKYRNARRLIRSDPKKYRVIPQGRGFLVLEAFGRRGRPRRNAPALPPSLRPIYALVPDLRIPARLGLRAAWDRKGPRELSKRMSKAINLTLRGKRIPGKNQKRGP